MAQKQSVVVENATSSIAPTKCSKTTPKIFQNKQMTVKRQHRPAEILSEGKNTVNLFSF